MKKSKTQARRLSRLYLFVCVHVQHALVQYITRYTPSPLAICTRIVFSCVGARYLSHASCALRLEFSLIEKTLMYSSNLLLKLFAWLSYSSLSSEICLNLASLMLLFSPSSFLPPSAPRPATARLWKDQIEKGRRGEGVIERT